MEFVIRLPSEPNRNNGKLSSVRTFEDTICTVELTVVILPIFDRLVCYSAIFYFALLKLAVVRIFDGREK